jgi:4-hydroxyphenylpyruvate dioxygenase
MPRRPRSIATVCLSGALPEKLEAAATAGFDGVEIFENDLLTFDGSPADARRIADDLGLAIPLYQPFRDFEAMPDAQRGRNLDRAERKFDVMEQLGCPLVLVCSNVQAAALDDDARAAADLAAMAERAARRGMRVGYEALAWGRHVNRWRRAWEVVQRADHPALGLIVDSFHTLAVGDDPAGIADVPGERLFFVQLADAPKLVMDVLSWSRHFRLFPGQGGLDVAGFLRAVAASGYMGPISLEVFNDDFRAAPARLTARDAMRSLVLVEADAGLSTLPDPPRFGGVEFLEFAVDAESSAALGGFLAALGFARAGRHRSKAVELWRQGGARLVLNQEPDSAASEHFHLHGPSVCAMGLRVDDATRALDRARALLCPEWQEPTAPGEGHLPGVRAPDGTLVYLVEEAGAAELWAGDFEMASGADGAGWLDAVDHVAQALPAGRMDGFVLFWRAVFGLEPQGLWELPDPYGLIQSRAMVSRDGTVRLPLSLSESRQTTTGRFVTAAAGAGVHHVAFATRDAADAASKLLRASAPLLPIPENYYDDLAARWGLDDATLDILRARRLLYDEDEAGGTFRHAYTLPFAGRFFFELAERRGGYAGFGAVNAAVRMAAQAAMREGDISSALGRTPTGTYM